MCSYSRLPSGCQSGPLKCHTSHLLLAHICLWRLGQPSLAVPPSSFEAISSWGMSKGLTQSKVREAPRCCAKACSEELATECQRHGSSPQNCGIRLLLSQDEYPLPAEQGDLTETWADWTCLIEQGQLSTHHSRGPSTHYCVLASTPAWGMGSSRHSRRHWDLRLVRKRRKLRGLLEVALRCVSIRIPADKGLQ